MNDSYKVVKNQMKSYQQELRKRRRETIDAIDTYFEKNQVDMAVIRIDDKCNNCSDNCQLEHYPVVNFVGYFSKNVELFGRLIINNETKSHKIEIEDKCMSLLCRVIESENTRENFDDQDIVDFISMIVTMIPIYLKTIDSGTF